MRFALLAPSSCLVPVVVVVLSSPAWLRPPGADGHGFLAKPPSKNGGDQTTRGEETAIYYSVASFGIIDKAYFDGDHSLTPWTRPGEFDHVMAREVVPGHPQTLHPCGCNAGGVAHCVGVEVATGFGETTLGAAPGVPPVLVPPEWPAGTSQEVGWNAYANHAGGYVYTMCPRDRYDSCRDTHLPHGPHLAGEEDTEAYLRCVWDCFEASTLGWVQDSQRVQYRDEACTYAITDPLTKVGRGGHVWRSTPIPDKGQVSSGNEGQCTWDSVVGFSSAEAEDRFTESFGTSDVCDYGPHQRSTKDWHVMDRVEIPSDLPEGEYLLGWRWDAYMADQMWTGCADVRIVAPSSASPQDPDCPTGPPTAGPPPPPPDDDDDDDDEECSDLALPGNWGAGGNTCSTYEDHGGTAYCAHPPIADGCCFCGGGSGTGPPPPPTYAPPTNPPPTYSPPTSAPPPDNECSDLSLPGAWGDAGRTCSTYEDHGGTAYCAHADLAESCCFCGGGSGTGPPPPPTYAPPTNPPPTAGPPPAPTPSPPAPTPSPPTSGPPGDGEGDSRMIAYLGNWQACPTPDQYAEYTHIVIAFAVSYTWSPSKNNCDSQCNIGSPVPICNNQNRQDLVDLWRSQGKKVIVSFGGAGMGGSWAGDNNDCWEYCFGKEASVVSQLDAIVRAQNFDGVDIDYEYFYNDGDAFSLPGSTGAKARYFLDTVTRDLKATLPAGQNLITHAPMEPDSEKGTEYYDILKANAANLDFLMPQYYNGWTRPALDGLTGTGAGSKAALPHYNDLVYDMFGGDATKVVFGFCISDCSGTGTNANAVQASAVMTELGGYHSCNGGAFFWVVNHDYGGAWSGPVGDAAGVGGSNCDA